MTDDRKRPDAPDLPAVPERDGPVARPTLDEGEMFIYSEEDCAEIAAEMFAWVRELPALSEAQAEEIATMTYELMTGAWADHVDNS